MSVEITNTLIKLIIIAVFVALVAALYGFLVIASLTVFEPKQNQTLTNSTDVDPIPSYSIEPSISEEISTYPSYSDSVDDSSLMVTDSH
jgi:flagellar basal body-associated protein FliL